MDALNDDEAGPRLEVFDSRGNPIRMERLVDSSGTFTIQSPDLRPYATYFLKVSRSDDDAGWKGKYRLTADFRQPASLIRTFSSATLSVSTPQVTDTLHVARTELFQFALTADAPDGTAVDTAVQMRIVDQNGVTAFERTATADAAAIHISVLLSPGTYSVRFTALDLSDSTNAVPNYPLTFTVYGFALSDPVGPRIEDPNSRPRTSRPPYVFPGGLVSTDPFIWINQVY